MRAREDVMIWIEKKAESEEGFIELHLKFKSNR